MHFRNGRPCFNSWQTLSKSGGKLKTPRKFAQQNQFWSASVFFAQQFVQQLLSKKRVLVSKTCFLVSKVDLVSKKWFWSPIWSPNLVGFFVFVQTLVSKNHVLVSNLRTVLVTKISFGHQFGQQ